jgi:hypothetical protein
MAYTLCPVCGQVHTPNQPRCTLEIIIQSVGGEIP